MAAKEKVLDVWPKAMVICGPENCNGHQIATPLSEDGWGSEEAAWQNAAEPIPAQPEPCNCGHSAKQHSNGCGNCNECECASFNESLPVEAKDSVCCFITCNKAATWQAWDGPQHDDYTEACDDHLGHLLSEKPEHRVWPLTTAEPKPTPAAMEEEMCPDCMSDVRDVRLNVGDFRCDNKWHSPPVEPKPTPSTPADLLEPWKDDPETPDDRVNAWHLHFAFNGSNHDAAVRFSRDLVHARRMLLEACAISRRLSEEIVELRNWPQPGSFSIPETFAKIWNRFVAANDTEEWKASDIAEWFWNAAKGLK